MYPKLLTRISILIWSHDLTLLLSMVEIGVWVRGIGYCEKADSRSFVCKQEFGMLSVY